MKCRDNKLLKSYIVLTVLLLGLFFFLMPRTGHPYDNYCWKTWTKYILTYGIGRIYSSGSDYLPLYYYILKVFGLIWQNPDKIDLNIQYIRLITVFFQFISGFFFTKIVYEKYKSVSKAISYSVFYLLNISILYNILVWGQVDAIMTCFIFLSFYFAYKKRILYSLIFLLLAINFKLQSIIFIPIIGLMLLPEIVVTFSVKRLLKWIFIPVILQLVILLPFLLEGTLGSVWYVIKGSMGKYPVVSMNAFNLWDFLVKGNLMEIPDSNTALGLTYKSWGLGLFLQPVFLHFILY